MKKNKTILLVEDDKDLQAIYSFSFQREGYDVYCRTKAETVIETVREKKPDIILLDFLLGAVDGLKVLEKLKKTQDTKDARVVFLTNYTDGKIIKAALDGGAEDVIIKTDFSPIELVRKIEAYLCP